MSHHRRDFLLGALGVPFMRLAMPDQNPAGSDPTPDYRRLTLASAKAEQARTGNPWLPLLAVPSLRCGLYVLPKGGVDTQTPHEDDEVYFIIAGRASFKVAATAGEVDEAVQAGDVLFVKRRVAHRFHDIEESLQVLVVFASTPAPR